MQHVPEIPPCLGGLLAAFFGGWEVMLILAIALVLYLAKRLPEAFRGFGRGFDEFRQASGDVSDDLRRGAFKAGESLGGIYGKPAADALTHDNRVAEFYDVDDAAPQPRNGTPTLLRRFWSAICRLLRRL